MDLQKSNFYKLCRKKRSSQISEYATTLSNFLMKSLRIKELELPQTKFQNISGEGANNCYDRKWVFIWETILNPDLIEWLIKLNYEALRRQLLIISRSVK